MAFSLSLPEALKNARWKVKIRDKETREPPHLTIIRGTLAWRIDLRSGVFMDRHPDPDEVPAELVALIRADEIWEQLRREWDAMYPGNPVDGIEE